MYNHLLFLAYWLVNTSVLFLAGILPGSSVVLGNGRFSSFESSFYAGFWLTFFIWVWWDFAIARRLKFEGKITSFAVFLIVNSVSIWAVSRFYFITGFVLTNYLWALLIGLMVTLLQRLAFRLVVGRPAL